MEKIRLPSYTYGCFLVSGEKAVQFLSIKNVHTMHFLFAFKILFEKKGGGIFGDHSSPSGDQKFILDRQLAPVSGAPNENIVQNHLNIELLNVF